MACALAVLPGPAGAKIARINSVFPDTHQESIAGYEYQTTYNGRYVFDYHEQQNLTGYYGSSTNGQDDLDSYAWTVITRELILPASKTSYTTTTYRDVTASGHRSQTNYDTSTPANNSAWACTITDDGKGDQTVSEGRGQDPPSDDPTQATLSANPKVLVSWQLPDDVVAPDGRIRETGSPQCANPTSAAFLGYTVTSPCNVCLFLVMTGDQKAFDNAWEGSAQVPLRTLASPGGYSTPIHAELTGYQTGGASGEQTSSLEQGYVQIDGTVTSRLIKKYVNVTVKGPGEEPPCNKAGALVFEDGLAVMARGVIQHSATDSGFPVGQNERVPLPLSPCAATDTGTAILDVSGIVLPSSHAVRRAQTETADAAAGRWVLLASTGRAHITAGWGERTLILTPTAAGRTLLSGEHGAIKLRFTLSVAATHPRHTYTTTNTATLPATTGTIPPLPN